MAASCFFVGSTILVTVSLPPNAVRPAAPAPSKGAAKRSMTSSRGSLMGVLSSDNEAGIETVMFIMYT